MDLVITLHVFSKYVASSKKSRFHHRSPTSRGDLMRFDVSRFIFAGYSLKELSGN